MKQFSVSLFLLILVPGYSIREYYIVDTANPVYKPNSIFDSFDDMATTETAHLISKFQLDIIFKGESDEFCRILLLRHWIKSKIPIRNYAPYYPGEGNVERILDYALQGEGYDCGYFMVVQSAIMGAYGHVSQAIGAGSGIKGIRDGHHGINEFWINQYNKWFLSDAKYELLSRTVNLAGVTGHEHKIFINS